MLGGVDGLHIRVFKDDVLCEAVIAEGAQVKVEDDVIRQAAVDDVDASLACLGVMAGRDVERRHAAVPAPEPETVPVPADLIQEAEEWNDARMRQTTGGASILARIVRAVREREGES